MKQIYYQTKTPKNIQHVFGENHQANFNLKTNRMYRSIASTGDVKKGEVIEYADNLFVFFAPNNCKGPPGRPRAPVKGSLPGEHKSFVGTQPSKYETNTSDGLIFELFKNNNNNELYNKCKNKFFQSLNFTNMKKQIFILILAVFAFSAAAFGQSVDMPASTRVPKTPVCTTGGTDSPLNPKPGKAYNYSVNIANSGAISGVVSDYLWWATKNKDFVTTGSVPNWTDRLTVGGGLIATGSNYGSLTGGTATMSITWSPATLANTEYLGTNPPPAKSPTFVAVMAKGACADNIQVWEINPQPAFTVDITNINTASTTAELYGNTISSCVSDVVSATYSYSSHQVNMDYGVNTIYFEVISANFVGTWTPTIQLGGLGSGETASVTIYPTWADAKAGTSGQETLNYAADGTQVGTKLLGSTVSDTSSGVSVWLGVTVDHNKYETITASTIRVTIDGMDSTGTWDLKGNCDTASAPDQDDYAEQTITPRPDINDITNDPATPVPGGSAPYGGFIPKN